MATCNKLVQCGKCKRRLSRNDMSMRPLTEMYPPLRCNFCGAILTIDCEVCHGQFVDCEVCGGMGFIDIWAIRELVDTEDTTP